MLPTGQSPERPLVLLAEHHAILALDIAHELGEAGFTVAGPISTRAELKAWTAFTTPRAAILHLTLRDGPCLVEAFELAERGIPVAIFTNSGANCGNPAVTWFGGPVEPRVLIRFLRLRTGHR